MSKMFLIIKGIQLHLSLFLFLFCLYALTTSGHFSTSMGVSVYQVSESLLREGDISLTEEEVKTNEFRIGKDGNYYCYESLGSIITPIPFIMVSHIFGVTSGQGVWRIVLLTNSILTAFSALVLYALGRELKYSRKTSFLLSLIYGLGTMAWAHTRFLMPDPLASLVYLVTFLFLLRYKRTGRIRELLLTGLWAGLALHCRPDAFLFVLAICVGVVLLLRRQWREKEQSLSVVARRAVIFVLPILVFVCLWGYYNYHRFGSVLETGYTVSVEEGSEGEGQRFGALSYVKRFVNVGGTVKGFLGMWVIPNRSIFFVNPILIFWLFALKPFWRKYRFEMTVYGIAFVLYVFLYSNRGAYGFAGSAAWGQRYFLPMIGFMVLGVGLFVERMLASGSRNMKILFVSVLLLSVCFQFVGISQTYQVYQASLEEKYGPEKARLMMTVDPRHSLLVLNMKLLRIGVTDFMYYSYLRFTKYKENGHVLPWVKYTFFLIVFTIFISGVVLVRSLLFASPEAVQIERPKEKKKRKKKRPR
jgi:4-amino-4-deoxy-L-arabinose transferase-like glycosyltransferase